jgi:hypothetical protein
MTFKYRAKRFLKKAFWSIIFALYWFLSRVSLFVILLFLMQYFLLNASFYPSFLSNILRSVLPGTLTFETIQISPIPWHVDVLGLSIKTPEDKEVISASQVRVSMNTIKLVSHILRRSNEPLPVIFESIRVKDFSVRIVFDKDKGLEFLRAFVRPKQGEPRKKTKKGTGVTIPFKHIIAENGSLFLSFPDWDMKLTGIDADTSMFISDEPRVFIQTSYASFSKGLARIYAAPQVKQIPREIEIIEGKAKGFDFKHDRFSIERAEIKAKGAKVEARGSFAFGKDANLSYEGIVRLDIEPDSPILEVATSGLVDGDLRFEASGKGDASNPMFLLALQASHSRIWDLALEDLNLGIRGHKDDEKLYCFDGLNASFRLAGGLIKIGDGGIYPFGRDQSDASISGAAKIHIESLKVASLLQTIFHDISKFTPDTLNASLAVEASSRGKEKRASLSGSFEAKYGPRSFFSSHDVVSQMSVALEISDKKRSFDIHKLHLASGSDSLTAKGSIDLDTLGSNLSLDLKKDLSSVFSFFGHKGNGLLSVGTASVAGTILEPKITGRLLLKDFDFKDVHVDEAEGGVLVTKTSAVLENLKIRTQFAQVEAKGVKVDRFLSENPAISVSGLTATKINLESFQGLQKSIKGVFGLEMPSLAFETRDWFKTMRGEGRLTSPFFQVAKKGFRNLSLAFNLQKGVLDIQSLECALATGGAIKASGRISPFEKATDLTVEVTRLSLGAFLGINDLQGDMSIGLKVSGNILDPELLASASLTGTRYAGISLGDIQIDAKRKEGSSIEFSSQKFLKKMKLADTSVLHYANGRFDRLFVAIDIMDLTPQDLFPRIRNRDLSGALFGRLEIDMPLDGKPQVLLASPPGGVVFGLLGGEIRYTNRADLELRLNQKGEVTISGLALDDGSSVLRMCGVLFGQGGRLHLVLSGRTSLMPLRFFRNIVSEVHGSIEFSGDGVGANLPDGCSSFAEKKVLLIQGEILRPRPTGTIAFKEVSFRLRGFGDEVSIKSPSSLRVLTREDGGIKIEIPDNIKMRGTIGEGNYALSGEFVLKDFAPDSMTLNFSGSQLRFVSAGSLFMVVKPTLKITVPSFLDVDTEPPTIAGEVEVTEGAFHENFDIIGKAFRGAVQPRTASKGGLSLQSLPKWLKQAELSVAFASKNFALNSKLPFGNVDLSLALDLALKGHLNNMQIWNRAEIAKGGKIVYSLVRREFEIVRGTIDFLGDPKTPSLDVIAKTTISLEGAQVTPTESSRFSVDTVSDSEGVVVTLAISGRYPNLNVSLTSNASNLDATDLQLLLLTGMSRGQAGETGSSPLNTGLITEDMTNLLTNALLSPFVDAIRFGVSPSGGLSAEVQAHMGSKVRFQTQVFQNQGTSTYKASFNVKLTSRFFLEGRVRAYTEQLSGSFAGRRQEAKIKYRIPLD